MSKFVEGFGKVTDKCVEKLFAKEGETVGLAGLALVALAYPVYNHVLQNERQRIAPQILRLTGELIK